jgi:hypothetical protein
MLRRPYRSVLIAAAVASAAALAPIGVTTTAAAVTCDTNPGDAVEAGWSAPQIAPNGSLAAGTSATVTVTAYNTSGQCVAGAAVALYFAPTPGGGTATTATTACPYGRLTPNWETCTTDGNGQVTTWYTTPSTLPNGGIESIQAKVGSQTPPQASYTYGALAVSMSAITATEGSPFSGTVATVTERDFASPPSLTAVVDWGDNSATSAGSVGGSASANANLVSAAHTYLEESPSGGYPTNITVSGSNAPTVTASGTATAADAALSATAVAVTGKPKTALTDVPVATFTDADPNGTGTDYSAVIDWGDGTSSAGTISAGNGFTVSGSHTYASHGTYTTTVTVSDVGGAGSQASGTATIGSSSGGGAKRLHP